jgi:hypothetical protein
MQRMHRLGQRMFIGLLGVVLGVGVLAPTQAQAATPTKLRLNADAAYSGQATTVRIQLTEGDGDPVSGQPVTIQRRVNGIWGDVSLETTNGEGRASQSATLARDADDNVFRALYTGDGATWDPSSSGAVGVDLKRRSSKLRLGGQKSVKEGKSVEITVRWKTGNGEGVPGKVKLFRKTSKAGKWKKARKVTLDADGRAEITVTPRSNTWWQARGSQRAWVKGDRSNTHRITIVPEGIPVRLPKNAPKPRIKLPPQPPAVGGGANPVITRIPNRVWNQMTGRTWHQGCPVGRQGLRYLRVNYWDYKGHARRGELVANADAIGQMAAALAEMYRKNLPIRAMYRVDRFGYSKKLRGGDDYKSMAAGNTSAFNCRQVVGNPGARSPHATGRSLDVNTWENPYRSAQGTVPNKWWMSHSHKRVAWRSKSHAVVRLMARHGLRWTYGNGDTQHFDARAGGARTSARLNAEFLECGGVCD